ncbi:MAG: CoA-binding protein [Bacteroidetes bacterium]|nr:CoA-binding protein [Bacteroidota bacterium]MBS1685787.1 CoA-binding protein [Bacteroidota bacterium]
MSDKLTLVIGASTDPERYANKAIRMLRSHGHPVVGVGRDLGTVADVAIQAETPADLHPDTVTLYVNPHIQKNYYDQIVALKPKRVIFNPGTENAEFEALLQKNGIEPVEACTLVLLSTNQY